MIVSELIKALKDMPPKARVLTDAHETGLGDVGYPRAISVYNTTGLADQGGDYAESKEGDGMPKLDMDCVYLPSRSALANLNVSDAEFNAVPPDEDKESPSEGNDRIRKAMGDNKESPDERRENVRKAMAKAGYDQLDKPAKEVPKGHDYGRKAEGKWDFKQMAKDELAKAPTNDQPKQPNKDEPGPVASRMDKFQDKTQKLKDTRK